MLREFTRIRRSTSTSTMPGLFCDGSDLNGAEQVDAVEIDPMLVKLSNRFNASGIYENPKVHVHVDDARAFLRRSSGGYDMVVFGFLDSQTLFSWMSNIRLDGYSYPVQSI